MKDSLSAHKTGQRGSARPRPTAAVGAKARALAAPGYGVAFADRRPQREPPLLVSTPQPPLQPQLQPQLQRLPGLPDRLKAGIESLSGLAMDAVRVHHDSPQPARLGALAFTQGHDIHLAPGQAHHLAHEAWHVVQQAQGRVLPTRQMKAGPLLNDARALEHEADVMGERALSLPLAGAAPGVMPAVLPGAMPAVAHGIAQAGRAARALPAQPAAVVQRYTEEKLPEEGDAGNTWRVSEDEQAMLEIGQAEGGQTLLATDALVDQANARLKSAGQHGSFVRLKASEHTTSAGGRGLKQVLPTFVDAPGARAFNRDMATANQPGAADATGDTRDWFKLYADCGRSARTVMGSLGLAPKALYAAGKQARTTGRAFDPAEWTDQVYLVSMKAFVNDPANRVHLKTEHLKGRFLSYFYAGSSKFVPREPSSGAEAKAFAGALDEAGQRAFAEYAQINVAVNPEIGEGYTMATGSDLPGFTSSGDTWNFHWAGVVMKAGSDNITLENYAIMFAPTGDEKVDAANAQRAYDFTNTDWVFQMYGTLKTGQSFHEEHLRSGTHGSRGTTLRVKI